MGEIERATPVQMRKSLEMAMVFRAQMIQFVPMPVIGDADKLYAELSRRLDILEVANGKDKG